MSLPNLSTKINALCGKIQNLNRRINNINVTPTTEFNVSFISARGDGDQNVPQGTTDALLTFPVILSTSNDITIDGANQIFTIDRSGTYQVTFYGDFLVGDNDTTDTRFTIEFSTFGGQGPQQQFAGNLVGTRNPIAISLAGNLNAGDDIRVSVSKAAGPGDSSLTISNTGIVIKSLRLD